MFDVARGENDPLVAGQAAGAADIEESFDLLVDAADRLDDPVLIDRAGDREALLDRDLGQRGQQREKLGGGSAVAVDAPIGLLENEARVQRQRPRRAKASAEET